MPAPANTDVRGVRRRLVAFALLAGVALVAVYFITIQTAWGQGIDDRGLAGADQTPSHVAGMFWRVLDTITASSLVLVLVGVLSFALVRRRAAVAVAVVVLVVGANVTTQVLKRALPRPMLSGLDPLGPSWPSGHTTVAMSLALAVLLVVPPSARPLTAVAVQSYALVVGVAVIGVSWHRPGDAVGAYLVSAMWAAIVSVPLVSGAARPPVGRARRRLGSVARLTGWTILGAILALLTAVLVIWLADLAVNHRGFAADDLRAFYKSSAVAVVLVGVAVTTCLAFLLRDVDLGRPTAPKSVASGDHATGERSWRTTTS